MSTAKPEKNGSGKLSHLSYEQQLLTKHTGLDSLPGFWVVVFERLKGGGARFLKLIQPGEIFRNFNWMFWDSPQNYFAIGVNQSTLRHAFDEPVSLDDNVHKFTLIIHLTYRAIDPKRVADLAGQDPLRRLCHEIARTLVRSCAKRDWEMIERHFRDLELLALKAEQPKLQQTAANLGLEIVNIELDSQLPDEFVAVDRHIFETDTKIKIMGLDHKVSQAAAATDYESRRNKLDHDYSLRHHGLTKKIEIQEDEFRVHRAEQYQQLLDQLDAAIGTALNGVGEQINTPAGLLDAFEALRNIHAVIKSDQGSLAAQAGLLAGTGPTTVQLLGAGEDKVAGLLNQVFKEIAQLKLTSAQKRGLTSNILHLTAEAMLDDAADEEVLKKYGEKLSELASSLSLTKMQYRELRRFLDYEQLRADLR